MHRSVLRELHLRPSGVHAAAVQAQARHAEISGVNRTFYCGAYWGSGFHEDGLDERRRARGRRDQSLRATPREQRCATHEELPLQWFGAA